MAPVALAFAGCGGTSASPSTSLGTASVAPVVRQGPSTGDGAGVADRIVDVSMDLRAQQVTLTDSLGEATTSPMAVAPRD